ncbi:HNH endonuclease [Aliidiomarina indica]|uniref:HNH endonuclease n=1 Tax=Aliidiomarina indica TaxID=2749147 RepID=UPI00188E163E|nr:HNH endonuclease [Aliidiomarina indica]
MSLNKYIEQFKDVRPNRSGQSASPHKVCMLFAVLDLIEDGRIGLNAIYYNEELKRRFAWHFERLKSDKDRLNFKDPFFYLRSSPFWHHAIQPGRAVAYDAIITPSDALIATTITHAFLDDELFLLLKDSSNRDALRIALSENLDSKEEGFKRWALSIGKSEKTVNNYVGALRSSISNWLESANLINTNLMYISDYFHVARLVEQAQNVPDFKEYNKRGNGMYLAALKLYRAYLDEITDATMQYDISVIEQDESLEVTQKSMLIQARRGQGKFRERLIQQWQRCAVTGYDNISLLLASHIKPWSKAENEERLDPFNGLLLIPNLDKAFDLNYVSFTDKGRILIAEQLGEYETLGIHKEMSVLLHARHQDYMAYHREVYFKKNA